MREIVTIQIYKSSVYFLSLFYFMNQFNAQFYVSPVTADYKVVLERHDEE